MHLCFKCLGRSGCVRALVDGWRTDPRRCWWRRGEDRGEGPWTDRRAGKKKVERQECVLRAWVLGNCRAKCWI